MPLYDVTHREVLVNPNDSENYDVIQSAMRELNAKRFKKDCDIIDEAIQAAIDLATANNRLCFTKVGIMLGHSSLLSVKDANHVWNSAAIAYPESTLKGADNSQVGELQRKFIGGLLRWRIALRGETWLVYRRESGKINKHTEKEIRVSEYWINEDYVPAARAAKAFAFGLLYGNPKKFSVEDLAIKWGAK